MIWTTSTVRWMSSSRRTARQGALHRLRDLPDRCDDTFAWLKRFRSELAEESAEAMLRDAQRLLCGFVDRFDAHRVRHMRGLSGA
jgi:hypothetical protein